MHGGEPLLAEAGLDPHALKKLLLKDAGQIDQIGQLAAADRFSARVPQWYYRVVLSLLTSMDLSEAEAENHFFAILQHRQDLSVRMGRDIGIRVACLDYFLHVENRMINPKLVEADLFEQLLGKTKLDPKLQCYNYPFFLNSPRQSCIRRAVMAAVFLF